MYHISISKKAESEALGRFWVLHLGKDGIYFKKPDGTLIKYKKLQILHLREWIASTLIMEANEAGSTN